MSYPLSSTFGPNSHRLILARCVQENLSVGVFLFNDVIILARKLMKNRKYLIIVALEIDTSFEARRNGLKVTFKNGSGDFAVRFSQLGNGAMWQQYASMWKQYSNYSKETKLSLWEENSPTEAKNPCGLVNIVELVSDAGSGNQIRQLE